MRHVTLGLLAVCLAAAACGGQQQQTSSTDGRPATADRAVYTPVAGTGSPASARDDARPPAAQSGAAAVAAEGRTVPGPAASNDAPRPPEWRELTIPAGTSLSIVLETAVASDTSRPDAPVAAHLARAVTIDGTTALPQGSVLSGIVSAATRAGKVKGRARVAMKFETLRPAGDDERYPIAATTVTRTAAATKKEDTVKVLAPAVGGAIIGRIAGGRKGAAIGAGAGAGAGTAVVLGTRGTDVRLSKGAALTLRLTEPLTVRVKG
jgi:hypothetical protein